MQFLGKLTNQTSENGNSSYTLFQAHTVQFPGKLTRKTSKNDEKLNFRLDSGHEIFFSHISLRQ